MIESPDNTRNFRGDILFAFTLALGCYAAWLLRDFLVLLYVSGLFAVVLTPVVRSIAELRVGRWKPFRGWALLVLLLAVAGGLALFGFLALPPVIADLQEFAGEMPARMPVLLEKLKHIPFADQINTGEITSRVEGFVSEAATYLLLSIRSWAGKLFAVVTGIVLTIYFILEGGGAYRWFLSFFKPESRGRLDRTLQRAEGRMGKWLLGQGSLMVILGVTSTIVFVSLHMRYAYALGVLTGLLNIIPVLGAVVSLVLAVLVAALDSWGRVVGVAIFFAVYLQVENSFITPRIMRSRVGLPGLAIFVALLLGSALEGVVGALVSVPTAVLVAVLVDEYLVNKDPA